jgi:hypothetical protein
MDNSKDQLEMFMFEDVEAELLECEDAILYFDMHPDWNDLDIKYDVTYSNDVEQISLEEFEKNIVPTISSSWMGVSESEQRDYIMWEETKPLTDFSEVDALKKDVANLTESLYKAYGRINELSQEVADLKSKLSQFNIHKNTRTF